MLNFKKQMPGILPGCRSRTAMSNRNGSLSQKLCQYLNQGRTLNVNNEGHTLNDLL